MSAKIAIILKGYPRLSETFIAQEIYSLQRAGIEFSIISLRRPTDKSIHPVHHLIKANVLYLPEYLHQSPLLLLKALLGQCSGHNFFKLIRQFASDFKRDFSRNRLRRLGQALILAHHFDKNVKFLYAHFLHTPATVAQYTSILIDLPWAASAHAKDIWTSTDEDLASKFKSLQWVATCTQYNATYLQKFTIKPNQVRLLYHGLDLNRFSYLHKLTTNTANDPSNPIKILSVGRAVEKKGFDVLLNALARLPKSLHWNLTHIGQGPLLEQLKKQANYLNIDQKITWLGAQTQTQVLSYYQNSDLFVLACRITANGDRDGLPNVIMEAQSQGLAVVSTEVSAVGELIENDINGKLVPSENPKALSEAICCLLTNAQLRQKLGSLGQEKIKTYFNHKICIKPLIQWLKEAQK